MHLLTHLLISYFYTLYPIILCRSDMHLLTHLLISHFIVLWRPVKSCHALVTHLLISHFYTLYLFSPVFGFLWIIYFLNHSTITFLIPLWFYHHPYKPLIFHLT